MPKVAVAREAFSSINSLDQLVSGHQSWGLE
jgi:hypothetical protein